MTNIATLDQSPFDRLVAGLEETRLDLGLSRASAARLGGLSEQMVYRLERGKCSNWHAAAQLRMAYVAFELSPLLPPNDEPPVPPSLAISTLSPAVADFKRELGAWEVSALGAVSRIHGAAVDVDHNGDLVASR